MTLAVVVGMWWTTRQWIRHVDLEDVVSVELQAGWYEGESKRVFLYEMPRNRERVQRIVDLYNRARSVDRLAETTPDTILTLRLTTGAEITVWTQHNIPHTVIGVREGTLYTHTNVAAPDLCLELDKARREGGFE